MAFLITGAGIKPTTVPTDPITQTFRPKDVAKLIPHRMVNAYHRAEWVQDKLCCDVLRKDLTKWNGQPLGAVFAKNLDWKAP